MSKKENLQELTAASKFVDRFFKGIINNTADRFLSKAKSSGVHSDIIDKLDTIRKETEELDKLIKKYSK